MSTEEAAEMAQKEKERKPPPMTKPEFDDRIKLVNELLSINVSGFEQRYRAAEKPYDQGIWLRKAKAVCENCNHILKDLEKQLVSPALKDSRFSTMLRVARSKVDAKLDDLRKDAPFDF